MKLRNILPILLLSLAPLRADVAPSPLDACDVTYTEYAKDSQDSMPTGNGDIGLNVWVEANGDLLLYISKTDAWLETNKTELVKLGRVRVTLDPNPFTAEAPFTQTLRLSPSEILIKAGGKTIHRVWVDANAPVVHIESATDKPTTTTVTLDPWRAAPQDKVPADVVLPGEKDRITWWHRAGDKPPAPAFTGYTFGAAMMGNGLLRGEGNTLRSPAPALSSSIEIHCLTATTPTIEDWRAALDTQIKTHATSDIEQARKAHQQWWSDFWNRSHIRLTGDNDAPRVTLGYTLQRYITACAGRGAYPVKFNGSIFVTDFPGNTVKPKDAPAPVPAPMNADTRAWGGQYWFQNTRPMYWPRLAAGDYDIMLPLFRMYAQILKNNAPLVKEYYGHDGSYMAETAAFFGGIPRIKPEDKGSYTLHYFTPVLELTAIGLDYYAHTQDRAFAKETLLPIATAGLTFFSQHFPRDDKGKLLLDADNAIEMYWKVKNPTPDIAALHWNLDRLLELPADLIDPATRATWEKLRGELPPIPTGERDGKKIILSYDPDQPVAPPHNSENPELYTVYPYRHYGVGKPDLQVALDTYAIRLNKRSGCWHQDPVQEALLGLTTEAKRDVTANLTRRDSRLRFPAFWDKGHDFAPDQDNGGHGELTLQWMLMQCEGKTIRLLPAWPKEWEVDFKLHAPLQTTVEAHVKNGQIVTLKVTPESRKADVVLPGAP